MVLPAAHGGEFELLDYYANPESYRSRFFDYLPHLTSLVNCIYWTEQYPRLITRLQAKELWSSGQRTLRVIGDISCDIDGSVAFTYKSTEPDAPAFVYDPITDRFKDGIEGRGIVVVSVDNLPCELPRESSDSFSSVLIDYVPHLAAADFSLPLAELPLPPALKRAIITHRGELAPDYRYLDEFLPEE